MPKREKLIALLKNSPNNIRFSDICKLLELEGFYFERITGSHHIFKKMILFWSFPSITRKSSQSIFAESLKLSRKNR
ncbi:type II toxin-antitoxin system HicA family toxin [Synechocystis sp. CACIAM 05]|uniref:type II toxin-antitoxin system HicA family toxin n=1 Tax=Synechocystis sp. CACIAM 05 TaxID=1933929 RepID=UPI00300D069A